MYWNSHGFVINRQETRNADKLLTLYTLELGKIRVIAQGARKSSARLAMATEPLVETEFSFFGNPLASARLRVIGGKIINLFPVIREDFRRYTTACQVAEVIDLLTYEQIKNEQKYRLIGRTFDLISTARHPERTYLAFLLRFLRYCGYGLHLNTCVMCSSRDFQRLKFSARKSGILCRACAGLDPLAFDISDDLLAYFKTIAKISGEEIDKINVPRHMDDFIEKCCHAYLMEYTHRPLKTKEFKKEIRYDDFSTDYNGVKQVLV